MNDKNDIKKETEKTEGPVRKIISGATQRKIYKGFNFLEPEQEQTISSEQIRSILPHRGHFLLLDEVLITSQKMIGKVRITEDMCLGHVAFNGKMIFRGSDFIDMAAQLLYIWAAQWPQLRSSLKTKICMPVEYGSSTLRAKVLPGDLVLITPKKVWARERTGRILIVGEKFTAEVEGKSRKGNVTVSSVNLLALNPESLAE